MGRFEGMTMVVTGAASGIGLATVRRLLADGATVVGCDLKPGTETPDGPGGYTFVAADITDEAAIAE
ncbi:MAG TPA: SDR family NAD(P)-dependent oxidoreductase, partial [Mycobacterium sp.]|nr:SDR family NAD(P)-dependent oxidoreductase [Mycobacterium sp.]